MTTTEPTSTTHVASDVGPIATRPVWRRVGGHPLVWIVGAWTTVNLGWLWVNRRSRLFELDEAGYAGMAARLSRQRTPGGIWGILHEGNHGPLQAILAAPPQWVGGSDPATLLWENVFFGAGTAAATYVMVARLAGRRSALLCATVVLLSTGVVQYSRTGLTVMPSVFFAAVAMTALVLGRGLERGRWAVLAGAAVGCMTLSRSMTIGFVPVVGVAALGWVISRRTPLRIWLRNGVLATAAALVVALWWWVLRWADVSEYLFGGGSADTGRTRDPVNKAVDHAHELLTLCGMGTVVVGAALYVGLQTVGLVRRRHGRTTAADRTEPPGADATSRPAPDPDAALALWPIAMAVTGGIAVLSVGTAYGVGFTLPLLAWGVAAATAAVGRTLTGRPWTVWAAVVVAVAVGTTMTMPRSGLSSELLWCEDDPPKSQCAVDTPAEARAWQGAIAEVGDRIWRAREAGEGAVAVALLTRDFLLNGNALNLEIELRHRTGVDLYRFFQPQESEQEQLRRMLAEADLLVVADDLRPDEVLLGSYQPAPAAALAAARSAGFTPCDEIDLPDGRLVTVLASPSAAAATCE